MSRYTYTLIAGGYDIALDGTPVIHQPFDPRKEGFQPIPDADREALAKAAIQALGAPPAPPAPAIVPRLEVALAPLGPDAGKAVIKGHDATLLFREDPTTKALLNGVRASLRATVGGQLLDGKEGRPSFDRTFRLPVQPVSANDAPAGPAIHVLATFTAGQGVIDFYPDAPVCYLVTQETISARLDPGEALELAQPIRIVGVR